MAAVDGWAVPVVPCNLVLPLDRSLRPQRPCHTVPPTPFVATTAAITAARLTPHLDPARQTTQSLLLHRLLLLHRHIFVQYITILRLQNLPTPGGIHICAGSAFRSPTQSLRSTTRQTSYQGSRLTACFAKSCIHRHIRHHRRIVSQSPHPAL